VETQTLTMNRPDHLLLDALWDAAAVAVPLAQALGLDEPAAVEEGLQRFRHPLRGERMGGVTFDACHNEAGIRQFARWAQRMALDADLLVGLSGRDPEVLAPLCGSGRSWFTVAAEHPKATEAEGLAQALRARGEEAVALSRSEAAALLRRKVAGKTDSLLAFGSIYAFGPLRDALQSQLR
jgi:folylpolyglutamate synthase/dihydropteroate synthase